MNKITRKQALLCGAIAALAVGLACIIPDEGIVVNTDCGREWVAVAPGAVGYNGVGQEIDIRTSKGDWVAQNHCLSPALSEQMEDPTSELYVEIRSDVVAACQARAEELSLSDDSCVDVATVTYAGECPTSDCTPAGETGGAGDETGGVNDVTGGDPGLQNVRRRS